MAVAVEFTDSDVNLTLVRLVFQTSSITYVGNVRAVTMCSSDFSFIYSTYMHMANALLFAVSLLIYM